MENNEEKITAKDKLGQEVIWVDMNGTGGSGDLPKIRNKLMGYQKRDDYRIAIFNPNDDKIYLNSQKLTSEFIINGGIDQEMFRKAHIKDLGGVKGVAKKLGFNPENLDPVVLAILTNTEEAKINILTSRKVKNRGGDFFSLFLKKYKYDSDNPKKTIIEKCKNIENYDKIQLSIIACEIATLREIKPDLYKFYLEQLKKKDKK